MFINDVVRLVNSYYPSEYDREEMYIWCDEVSSMLLIEDRNIFKRITLNVADDGTILLPDGVDMENIIYVTCDGKLLNKTDFREYNTHKFYIGLEGYSRIKPNKRCSSVTVDYLKPYEAIRRTKYRGRVMINTSDDTFEIDFCEFRAGDIVTITVNDSIYDNIMVLGISYDGGKYIVSAQTQAFKDAAETSSDNAQIMRIVTDETVCDAPFDSMYIDYVLAKINMYQRDTDSYNRHMTVFNSRLAAYKKWLISRMPKTDGQFKNWW